jgi:ATP-dependent 26S proteasome regulatory subunit
VILLTCCAVLTFTVLPSFLFCSVPLSGDGAKLIRDAFDLAKEKITKENRKGAIIFIDELDAIGTKRYGGEQSGDREVQRTMLELLNQLDGFSSNDKIKVIAATNRPDTLDPALLRSGEIACSSCLILSRFSLSAVSPSCCS